MEKKSEFLFELKEVIEGVAAKSRLQAKHIKPITFTEVFRAMIKKQIEPNEVHKKKF